MGRTTILIDPSCPFESLGNRDFPTPELKNIPITAIEGLASFRSGSYRGVCSRACLGCCADAIHPVLSPSPVHFLTPMLLKAIFAFVKSLAFKDIHIFSRTRLNLYSGSNELENPNCITFRKMVSEFFMEMYGFPLGAISSDIVFHPATSKTFKQNLMECLNNPLLFDNICVAVDEQLPMHDSKDYKRLLAVYEWIWKKIKPALLGDLDHYLPARLGKPRVIINFLLPSPRNSFSKPFQRLYPGGPLRSSSYEELAGRYLEPFLGKLIRTSNVVPPHHLFTTAIGTFANLRKGTVYISEAVFEGVGRANLFLRVPNDFFGGTYCPTIRTKLYPAGITSIAIQACLAPNPVSEGELLWTQSNKPSWVNKFNSTEIELSKYLSEF